MSRTMLWAVDTKARRLATAEAAVRTWRWYSELSGSARCPICGIDVFTVRRLIEGELEPWGTALVGAMFEHFSECPKVTR